MKKNKKNWFIRLISILFIIFIALFIAGESGFYEAKVKRNVALTDEAIKQFEEDILTGKEVDIKKYLTTEDKDYSNTFTRAGDKMSNIVEEIFSGGITNVWEIFKYLFT